MERSLKRRWRHQGWKVQESQRDIKEFLEFNECPGLYKTRERFLLWRIPANETIRGMISRDEIVILLDVCPIALDIGHDKFSAATEFYLMTSRGVGYITFVKHDGDGGILPQVKRMLDACT